MFCRQALAAVDPIAYVGSAAPASLYYQFAQSDSFISEAAAQAYYAAGSEPKQIRWYKGLHSLSVPEAAQDRDEWLAQELGLASAP